MKPPNLFAALAERVESLNPETTWIPYLALFGAVAVLWRYTGSAGAAVLLTLLLSWLLGYVLAGALLVLWIILRLADGITRLLTLLLARPVRP
ncbi:hypothetical protein [Methylococcus sp. Mc7]|uniref:hypothetical protein n=1 Tax=Methylococcus sp. Mc7 TaxID=2860258 RepID=UPI001C52DD30|nr:hypothetical protein [Methylococcus sp. Mc7]QXP84563.1 hypothetical protein KW115_02015 [Methylococcus sp. Mc7]